MIASGSGPTRTGPAGPAGPSDPGPHDVAAVLRVLVAEPGRPRLTWYGHDGERVELSGAVLANWVAKTTNLLVEEFDAAPGTRVQVELPAHWRTVVWTLATWTTGATLVLASDATVQADVLVTTDEAAADTAGTTNRPADPAALVVVTLAALARRAAHPLPAGATDAAAAVMTYPDQLGWVSPPDADAVALEADDAVITYRGLPGWWASDHEPGTPPRLVLGPGTGGAAWLAGVLRTLAAGGSVVLVDAGTAERLRTQPDALARLVTTERATVAEVLDPAAAADQDTGPRTYPRRR
ncbi:TIGR03089 family protein [Cellulomonas composti]|uniref:TIGR03089 family protein n=1 Tax=Cellulomonas composti TaxID=266130 RepID=A0A511JAY9_9CELL|nr:TIGR03089 family protein [Cellulomonas composti]GEL95155.1 TIGR03089 family protein [Cellulomonas composti]